MGQYDREHSYGSYAPKVYKDTFLNEAVAGDGSPLAHIELESTSGTSPLVPPNPSHENLPILDPKKRFEEKRAQGDGLGVGEVYDLGWEDGSGTKRSVCIFGHHIKDSIGKVTASGITGNVAEVTTVTCVAKSNYSNGDYFVFHGIDADGNNPVVKHYVWLNVDGGGSDPSISGHTAHEADISGDSSAGNVGNTIAGVINALDDFTASNNSGVVTITNGTAGAVDNAWASTSNFTISVTTDGVTTKTISESTTLPNIGFHVEKELSGEDIRTDHVGVTQIEYTWEIEQGGLLEEERNYLVAYKVNGSNLTRPRGPDGNSWTSAQNPLARYKRAFNWGDMSFTFQYNGTDIECKILSISIKVMLGVDYKRDDGSSYSNGRQLRTRDYEITMRIRPTGSMLRTISQTHYKNYDGDLTLTVKAQRGADTNDYIQWSFDKLRLIPFDQILPVEPYYEEHDIVLHAAPANTTTVTVKGYLNQQYFGVD